jgi:hypothetical protein
MAEQGLIYKWQIVNNSVFKTKMDTLKVIFPKKVTMVLQ